MELMRQPFIDTAQFHSIRFFELNPDRINRVLSFDTQSEIIQEVTNKLICEEGLTDKDAQEEADYYINTHNFANEFLM